MDTLCPYTTLFRSAAIVAVEANLAGLDRDCEVEVAIAVEIRPTVRQRAGNAEVRRLHRRKGGFGRPGRPAAGNAGRQDGPGTDPHQFIAPDTDYSGWAGQKSSEIRP